LTKLLSFYSNRKRARNCGEDLLDDMLSLDKLSGLFPEDRAGRKSAIAGLEAFLDDVDTMKANLVKLQKSLETNQEQRQHKLEQDALSSVAKTEAKLNSSEVEHTSPQIPAPGSDLWKTLRASVDFASKELATHYTISAAVPNLERQDIELSLNSDKSVLTITGVRLPTGKEAQDMQNELRERLQNTGHDLTDGKKLLQVALQSYVRMSRGRYGKFSESFRFPRDVDVDRIQASYTDGVLSINLPKRVHQARSRRSPRMAFPGQHCHSLW